MNTNGSFFCFDRSIFASCLDDLLKFLCLDVLIKTDGIFELNHISGLRQRVASFFIDQVSDKMSP